MDRRTTVAGLLSTLVRSPAAAAEAVPADLDRMIGSMAIMGFRGGRPADEGARLAAGQLASGRIGGVILFDDNLESPAAVRDLIGSLKEAAKPGIALIGVDQEGGLVSRLRADRGFPRLPSAQAVGQMTDAEAAVLDETTARELHELGFNINFGPVVDLDVNPANPIIGALGRSYGADPDVVVDRAKLFIDAHRRHHVLTALKHFPGHGSSLEDSHVTLPDITETWRASELKPFASLIASGSADMVMMGHLVNRTLAEPDRPASLSSLAVQKLLRQQLGFDGVVVTDDMQMGALRRLFAPDEAILLGLEAGIDLFVFSNHDHPDPEMPDRFHRVVNQAIADARITRFRVEHSAQRIARLKQSLV